MVWGKLKMNAGMEMKRAISIWKENTKFNTQRVKALKRLLKNRRNETLTNALYLWRDYNQFITSECRLLILKKEYAQKVYLT